MRAVLIFLIIVIFMKLSLVKLKQTAKHRQNAANNNQTLLKSTAPSSEMPTKTLLVGMTNLTMNDTNPVVDLLELLQKQGRLPIYEFTENKSFKYIASVNGTSFQGIGESKSKKKAKQAAAKKLLDKLADVTISEEFYSNHNSTGNAKTPSTVLLELMRKQNRTSSFVLVEKAHYQCKVSAGDIKFEGFGEGNSKAEAKIVASKELLDKLTNTSSTMAPLDKIVATDMNHTDESTPSVKKKSFDSPFEFDLKNSNFVGALKSLCKLQKLPDPVFETTNTEGPAHLKTFTVKCSMQQDETFGKGNSLRQAKQNAAEVMWNLLKDRMNA